VTDDPSIRVVSDTRSGDGTVRELRAQYASPNESNAITLTIEGYPGFVEQVAHEWRRFVQAAAARDAAATAAAETAATNAEHQPQVWA
jgi:hypothetical protein